MKKSVLIILAAAVLLQLPACSGEKAGSSSGKSTSKAAESAPVSETASQPENESSEAGSTPAENVSAGSASSKGAVSQPGSAGTAAVPKVNIKGQTVELFTTDSGESEASKRTVAEFKKLYDATLKITTADWANYESVLNSRIMSDKAPDVAIVRNADRYTFPLKGVIQDITGKIDFDSALWKDIKALNESIRLDGKQYQVAGGSYVGNYIWYNKSIMADNGIVNTPEKLYDQGKWTVGELRRLAKELTVRDGEQITQYGLGADYGTLSSALIIARRGELLKRNGRQFSNNMNDPAVADAMNMLYDLYVADKVMTPVDQHINHFARGRAAMMLEGSWLTQQKAMKTLKTKNTIAMVPFPAWDGSGENHVLEAASLGIPKGTKNKDGGIAYINYYRYATVNEAMLKENRDFQKKTYAMTDKELDYISAIKSKGNIPSWYGLPNSPAYLMAMHVAYGNSWAVTIEKYAPDLNKSVDELNKLFK